MGDLDDAALARRILGAAPGTAKEAEAELMERFAPRIRLYGLRHLRDEPAAQDLVQEVLVITLEALRARRLREPERVASFVLGTCRLVVQNLRRGRRRRESLLATFGEALAPAPAPAPALDRERLAECLRRLPDRERAAIVLTFYADASAEEIARELGTSPGNVRVVRHRAMGRLWTCLEGPG
jgi:RNA polymerase sigma-70 factor (ECF subfamily)